MFNAQRQSIRRSKVLFTNCSRIYDGMADKPERIPRYQALKLPEFKSTVPDHLIDKLSPQEKWVIEAISRMEQRDEWIIAAILDCNRSNIESDLRIQELQDWQALISSKWAVLLGCLALIAPVLLEKILGWAFGH